MDPNPNPNPMMIAQAVEARCGDADITLAEVKKRYNKRLIIAVTELNTGSERYLTPETDPDMPIRIAVRMSMGVPGLMEPLRTAGAKGGSHVYVDGGMCNDFPLNALPDDGHRLGLMIRPREWMAAKMQHVDHYVYPSALIKASGIKAHLDKEKKIIENHGVYPVHSCLSFAMTCCQVMMDANLMLQLKLSKARKGEQVDDGLDGLIPEVLALCGGGLDAFNFDLSKDQHLDLYLCGQLAVHLHAALFTEKHARESPDSNGDEEAGRHVMCDDDRLKTLLLLLHLSERA